MNPYQSPLAHGTAGKGAGSSTGWLFHVLGAVFFLLALFSWFLIADYMRPVMRQSKSSYQLLDLLFALAFFTIIPFVAYCLYYARNISNMSIACKLLLGVYVAPLLGSWLTAIFIYR